MSSKPNPEQLAAIGLLFVQARTRQNLALEDLSEQLRIPGHYLIAIEQAQVEKLPEPVYVRGFVRKYAQALNLGEDPQVVQFLHQKTDITLPLRNQAQSLPAKGKPSLLLQWGGYGLAVVVVVVGLSAALNTYWPQLLPFPPNPPLAQQPTEPVEVPSPPIVKAPLANPTPAPPQSADGPLNLAMNVTANSWSRVVVDGKTQFEGTLTKGDTRKWQAQKSLKVRLGNAGGVILTYNDKVLGPAGKSGEALTRTFER
ncbi:RodZ domain-containing protein [Candidatus Cyanaurora vandensis]|uniref:helix-turn-helix domain-containing protein n=1 Tax=Candidatus Cyanaurora vandensis TaxID=2714958 RepID=UPI00257CDB0C|nr:RodZ domain-containing protein [Candidatus Cyanaurora vandensis]